MVYDMENKYGLLYNPDTDSYEKPLVIEISSSPPQFIYRPNPDSLPDKDPLTENVKVHYRFHSWDVCPRCQYMAKTNKCRSRLLYKAGVSKWCHWNRYRNNIITHDQWIINLRGPDWKPKRVIKLKKRKR